MLPREHGAYGQLGFPLVTALALGDGSLAAWCLAAAAVAVFLAHEPALVLLGLRGRRARVEQGDRARRWIAVTVTVALTAGLAGLARAPDALTAAALPLALAVPLTVLIARRAERSLIGESLAALTMTAVALPVAVAGHASGTALTAGAVWAACLVSGTVAVRAVIAHARTQGASRMRLAGLGAGLSLLAGAAAALRLGAPVAAAMALIPFALMALGLCAAPPSPKRLRVVGWSLIGASTVTCATLIAGLRGS